MAAVRIEVGAALMAQTQAVFREAVEASRRAQRALEADSKAAARRRLSEAEKAAKAEARAYEQASNAAVKARERQMQADRKAFDERLKASAKARAAEERDILAVARKAEQAAARQLAADKRKHTTDMTSRGRDRLGIAREAAGNFAGIARGAGRFAGAVARGFGVNLGLESQVSAGVNVRKEISNLVNSAWQPGAQGAAGQRANANELLGEVRGVADRTGMSREGVVGGLQGFVGKTGDLETGRAVMEELARLSTATGTEMEAMVSAAGDVSIALGDTPDKANKLLTVMKAIAGQGKLGAVEIADLATQMAKVAAGAPQFEGDISQNIIAMGAMAQLARARGGAATAQSASQTVVSFINTLKTPARAKAFKEQGIDVFNDQGMLRDPFSVIRQAIQVQGNNPLAFKKMFANMAGARGAEALAGIYRQAGGGAKGMSAVDAEIQKLKDATMAQGDIATAFGDRMKDGDVKAQLFNNKMEDAADTLAQRMLPVFEKAAPVIEQFVDGMIKAVSWAQDNPGQAIAAAIAASIGKAAIGNAMGGGSPGGAILGGGGGVAGNAMAAIAITATAVTLYAAGVQLINQAFDASDKAAAGQEDKSIGGINTALDVAGGIRSGTVAPSDVLALQSELQAMDARIQSAEKADAWYYKLPFVGRKDKEVGADVENLPQLKQDREFMAAQLDKVSQLLGGTLKVSGSVSVTNMPTAPPGVDKSGVGGSGMPVPEPRG